MTFGTWPPVTAGAEEPKYAAIDGAGGILFQTTPNFILSAVRNAVGNYTITFVPGTFVVPESAVFLQSIAGTTDGDMNAIQPATDEIEIDWFTEANVPDDTTFYMTILTNGNP